MKDQPVFSSRNIRKALQSCTAHLCSLNFQSSTYEWLVVSGARAQYKSVGTINGAGNFGFLLTAIDGQLNGGGGGTDKFRIKI